MKYTCLIMTCWVLVVTSAGCASYSHKGSDRVPHRSKHYKQFKAAASRPKGGIPMPNRDSKGDLSGMLTERYASYSQPKPPVIKKISPRTKSLSEKAAEDSSLHAVNDSQTQAKNHLPRRHIRFDDDAAADRFFALLGSKVKGGEDVQFVAQLFKERKAQRQAVLTALHSQFGIEPDQNYRYDSSSRTIHVLSDPNQKKPQGSSIHRRLTDAAAADQFVGLVTRRQEITQQLLGLQALYADKVDALKQANQQLVDTYGIHENRQYQYEATPVHCSKRCRALPGHRIQIQIRL